MNRLLYLLALLCALLAGSSARERGSGMELRANAENGTPSSPMAGALQNKKMQGEKLATLDAKLKTADDKFSTKLKTIEETMGPLSTKLKTIETTMKSRRIKRGPPGVAGATGARGATGERGDTGRDGRSGAPGGVGKPGGRGPRGVAGTTGARGGPGERGDTGRDGHSGAPGGVGKPGDRGPRGVAGTTGARGGRGERGDTGRDGRGGAPGRVGKPGDRGPRGVAGTGLTLKSFSTGSNYSKGDYVFSRARAGKHNSMFVAERNFVAKTVPSGDIGNWEEFQAPKGEKGNNGTPGLNGKNGATGPTGATGAALPNVSIGRSNDDRIIPLPSPAQPGDFEVSDFQVYKVKVKGEMTNKNIRLACEANGFAPVCDHDQYMDGQCVMVHGAWHLSYPPHNKGHPDLPPNKLKGVYTYCGSANERFSRQNTGTTHRWSTAADKNGETLCTIRRAGQMINWNTYRFVRVRVEGKMNSNNIINACKKAKMKPLCDHSFYSDEYCLKAGGSWYFSQLSSNKKHDVPPAFMKGVYLYCGSAGGGKTLLNTGDIHRWSKATDKNGETVCGRKLRV